MELIFHKTLTLHNGKVEKLFIPIETDGHYWIVHQSKSGKSPIVFMRMVNGRMIENENENERDSCTYIPALQSFTKSDKGIFLGDGYDPNCRTTVVNSGIELEIKFEAYIIPHESKITIIKRRETKSYLVDRLFHYQEENARLKQQIKILQEALDRPGNIGATFGWDSLKDAIEKQPCRSISAISDSILPSR